MTNDEILQQTLANIMAKGQKMVEKQQEKLRTDRKTVLKNWEVSRNKRRDAEHEAKVKNGRELANGFIQEAASAYLRMVDGPEKLEALQTIRIQFIPGKSDGAASPSVAIMDGNKRLSTVYTASLQQLQERETRLMGKLRTRTGFQGATPIEMMEEIARLQGNMGKDAKTVGELSPIVAAAQQLLLIRAEGGDIKDALVNLEQQFLPAHKRTANIVAAEAANNADDDDDSNDDA
jgi:hypothetical protein